VNDPNASTGRLLLTPGASVSSSDQTATQATPYRDSDVKEARTDSVKGHTTGSSGGVPVHRLRRIFWE